MTCVTEQVGRRSSRAPHPKPVMTSDAFAPIADRLSRAFSDRASVLPSRELLAISNALVDAVAASSGAPTMRLVEQAMAHGERRRVEGRDAEAILEDYAGLRQAIWRVLHDLPNGSDAQVEAIGRVDAAATLAMRASILGHSRPQLERAGRWTGSRDELLSEARYARF